MLFSIIIPVYKVEKYIFQALESLRTQSFSDWEAVIVDDYQEPSILGYSACIKTLDTNWKLLPYGVPVSSK